MSIRSCVSQWISLVSKRAELDDEIKNETRRRVKIFVVVGITESHVWIGKVTSWTKLLIKELVT